MIGIFKRKLTFYREKSKDEKEHFGQPYAKILGNLHEMNILRETLLSKKDTHTNRKSQLSYNH